MANPLSTVGATLAGAAGLSAEHQNFLKQGCSRCHARSRNVFGGTTVTFYGSNGRKVSQWAFGIVGGALVAETAECPKCGYRWKVWGASGATPSPTIDVHDIVETERTEEFCGQDHRIINNLGSSVNVTRCVTFSRDWTRSYHLETERALGEAAELTIGAKDAAALKLSSEDKLRRTFSISEDRKETCSEVVSCEVPGGKSLTIIVRWKHIWQHGFVLASQSGKPLRIPFRVTVGMTFDQEQTETSN